MKKTPSIVLPIAAFLTAVFVISATVDSHAQIWKNMGKKIEKKIENQASKRLERKIDKTIDKGFDKAEGAAEDAIKNDNDKADTKKTAKESGAVVAEKKTLASVYSFPIGVTYDMNKKGGKKEEKLPSTTLWLSAGDYVGMSSSMQKDMFMVMDNGQMIAFMEQKKTYIVLGSGLFEQLGQSAVEEAEGEPAQDYDIKQVGSEELLGYPCTIYEITSTDQTARIWITEALSFESSGFMGALSYLFKNTKTNMPDFTKTPAAGVLMKMETTDSSTNETIQMVATAVHTDGRKLRSGDYQSMGF